MVKKFKLSSKQIDGIINLALAEDIIQGDVTSETLIPANLQGRAIILAQEKGVLAGGEVARGVFLKVSPSIKVKLLVEDGTMIKSGDILATVSGRVIDILKAERVALNFLQRLSGIASLTARYVAETNGLGVRICDTRKTTPGLRLLEKYAVATGGGENHRFHLGDGVLIKDNHLTALRNQGISLKDIVAQARRNAPEGSAVEVEASNVEEALEAVQGGADVILLDNMSPDEMHRVVGLIPGHIKTEASGGITLANIRAVAISGVDTISIGALTHSVKALDISLELEPETTKPVQSKSPA